LCSIVGGERAWLERRIYAETAFCIAFLAIAFVSQDADFGFESLVITFWFGKNIIIKNIFIKKNLVK